MARTFEMGGQLPFPKTDTGTPAGGNFFDWPSGASYDAIRLSHPQQQKLPFNIQDVFKDGMLLFCFNASKNVSRQNNDMFPYTFMPPQVINRAFMAMATPNAQSTDAYKFAQEMLLNTSCSPDGPNPFNDMDLFRDYFKPMGFLELKVNPFQAGMRMNDIGILSHGPARNLPDLTMGMGHNNDYVSMIVWRKPLPEKPVLTIAEDTDSLSFKGPGTTLFMEPYVSYGKPDVVYWDPSTNMLVPEPYARWTAPMAKQPEPGLFRNVPPPQYPVLLEPHVIIHIGEIIHLTHSASNAHSGNPRSLVNYSGNQMQGYRKMDMFVDFRTL